MTKNILVCLLLPFFYTLNVVNSDSADFIISECQTTLYPTLCIKCLSNYSTTINQNQRQLAQAALTVSLTQAQDVSSFVYMLIKMRGVNPREYQALKDCLDNFRNTIDQLSRSVKELDGVSSQKFDWHVKNVMTWCSTAWTNENTCLDGFSGTDMDGDIKVAIRKRVVECAQVTSNALALVNRFAARHNVHG